MSILYMHVINPLVTVILSGELLALVSSSAKTHYGYRMHTQLTNQCKTLYALLSS